MGSRAPSTTRYVRTPTAPIIYTAKIPDKDFQAAADYTQELKAERAKKKEDLASAGFGAADMAARQKSYLQAEQDAYAKAAPKTSIKP